ncbi:hypothetical protein KTQ96_14355 [Prevotella copri]|uniref:hypothetical protein n=1 Tax=Segatella copri TaxID=165179 RepID=UPI001C2BA883|nr:hypothetical protein [Segatella copri]MBU9909101.1 hypothetical protein [Segatella copri]MBV3374562.1 hypothetical protein [Segatella copri]
MIEDFIFDNLDSFNDIDTSDINLDDGLSGASSDLDDSFAPTEEIDFLSSTYKCNFLGADNKQ